MTDAHATVYYASVAAMQSRLFGSAPTEACDVQHTSPFVRSSVTELVDKIMWKRLNQFSANGHKWPTGQGDRGVAGRGVQGSGPPSRATGDPWDSRKSGEKCAMGRTWGWGFVTASARFGTACTLRTSRPIIIIIIKQENNEWRIVKD